MRQKRGVQRNSPDIQPGRNGIYKRKIVDVHTVTGHQSETEKKYAILSHHIT